MKIVDLLTSECVCLLDCRDKASALEELAKNICQRESSLELDSFVKAIMHRESLMSTGLGEGLAVPHVRLDKISQPVIAIGVSADGIDDYGSLDSKPVHIMVMIAAPAGQHEVYLQLMAQVVEKLRDSDTRQSIIDCQDSDKIVELLI